MEFLSNLSTKYTLLQWEIIVSFFSLVGLIILGTLVIRKIFEPKYKKYKQDMFKGMLWKWRYKGEKVIDLWCYCPACKSMLQVDDENCKTTLNLGEKITFFVCNNCEEKEIGRIKGGDRRFALKSIKREIFTKIRLNTFDIYKEH